MASVFDIDPCGSPVSMVTSVIQTRVFTVAGPVPIDCDSVSALDDPSSCNVWSNALQDLSVIPCSGALPPPPPPPPPPPTFASSQEGISFGSPINLSLGVPYLGTADYNNRKFFRVEVSGAGKFRFDVEGRSTTVGTINATLAYPALSDLQNSSGVSLSPSWVLGPDFGGVGTNLSFAYTFPAPGIYYYVLNQTNAGFTFRATFSVDSGVAAGASPFVLQDVPLYTVGGTFFGEVLLPSKINWCRFNLVAGVRVSLSFDHSLETLHTPTFFGIYLDGVRQLDLSYGTDGVRLFTPTVSGQYYLAVGDPQPNTGVYYIQIQEAP